MDEPKSDNELVLASTYLRTVLDLLADYEATHKERTRETAIAITNAQTRTREADLWIKEIGNRGRIVS